MLFWLEWSSRASFPPNKKEAPQHYGVDVCVHTILLLCYYVSVVIYPKVGKYVFIVFRH